MDYLALEAVDTSLATVLLVVSIVAIFGSFTVMALGLGGVVPDRPKFIVPIVALLLSGIVGMVFGIFMPMEAKLNAMEARDAKVIDAIGESYGVELTEREFARLNYPESEPEGSFELFGSVEKAVQIEGTRFNQRELYLVWADGSFGLSQSENGEDFEPLKRRD